MTTSVSDKMRVRIVDEIDRIEREHEVRVLFAIESGSRAWGFHSFDSDYDVRFVYARPTEWHFQLGKLRDVIEVPIDDELDVSGWELRKALELMSGSNAVIAEWLQSPILYRDFGDARAKLLGLSRKLLTRRPVTSNYTSMLKAQMSRAAQADGGFQLKRFFYALRPALALRWMRLNEAAVAPMNMAALVDGCALPAPQISNIEALIERKKQISERGMTGDIAPSLVALIDDELAAADQWLQSEEGRDNKTHALLDAQRLHFEMTRDAF